MPDQLLLQKGSSMEKSIFLRDESTQKVGPVERGISAVAGGVLVGYGIAGISDPRNSNAISIPALIVGGLLLARGLTGYSLFYRILNINRSSDKLDNAIRVERAVTVNQPIEDVFSFWMALENLPRFMDHLEMVNVREDGTSHWVAKGPLGTKVEWDARITQITHSSLIAWESLPGSGITNAGEVHFKPAPGDRGTEVYVRLEYKAPGGSAGAALARLLGEEPDVQIREDLRRFKALLETGDIITVEGQSSGRESI
jgi:uncharacterized membrane protein